jgi:hypothetical protein
MYLNITYKMRTRKVKKFSIFFLLVIGLYTFGKEGHSAEMLNRSPAKGGFHVSFGP